MEKKTMIIANKKYELQEEVCKLDRKIDNNTATDQDCMEQNQIFMKLCAAEKLQNEDVLQKSRIKWSINGDENSKFFHTVLNKQRRQMMVRGIKDKLIWHEDASSVKEIFFNHFSKTYCRFPSIPLINRSAEFKCLEVNQMDMLDAHVYLEEIKNAIWNCGSDKAPGPDGFTFGFIKRYWSLMQNDISCGNC